MSEYMQINHIMYKCMQCMECIKLCPEGALSCDEGVYIISKDYCTFCGKCVDVCVNEAMKIINHSK